jgi:DNA topoisomerase-3
MEHGQLSRAQFMADIAAMTERLVKKAKEYDRDTVPGNYATLAAPCPNCAGVVRENYRRYACTGADGKSDGCGFSFGKTPAGRTFEPAEVEQFLRDKHIGPLAGFRSKAGWPFTAELTLKLDEEAHNYKLEFDFGDDKGGQDGGELVDFAGQESLGACPKCGAAVFEHGKNYVCEKSQPTAEQPTPSCDFKSAQVILQQPVERAQMHKLLASGKTDLLDKFVSMRTRRAFKAMLVWDGAAGKVNFEFAPSKFPPRKSAAAPLTQAAVATNSKAASASNTGATATKVAKKSAAPAKKAAAKAPRKTAATGGSVPSAALAAVIGPESITRQQAIKKLWDYIKAHNLQDPKDKRVINADAKLQAVLGAPSVGMFALAGAVGPHLG